ncbi:MAG: L-threonylcarbamoyladenylate synthase [Candidatus Aenigmatarchaeota archaeon]
MTLLVRNPDQGCLEETARKIKEGDTCIYPTETCYGLGTNALDPEAVEKIYDIKERDRGKKLSCIVSSLEQAEKYCKLSEVERKLCDEFMPGPLTLVTEKKEDVPDVLNQDFVFRVSSNDTARKLAEEAGVPVVATSANFSGAENRYSIEDISRVVRERVDVVLDCGELEEKKPSTVVKLKDGEPEVVREGPVTREQIETFLSI